MNIKKSISINKISALLMVVVMLFIYLIPLESAHAVKYPCEGMSTEKVNLRKSPRVSSTLLYRLEKGTIVTILGSNGDFYNIKYGEYTGYAQKDYIQIGTEPTPTPTPAKFLSLSINSSGYEVSALQEALTELKFYSGEIDGKFGKSTLVALKAFQKINGIKENGIADDDIQRLIYDERPLNKNKNQYKVKTLPPIQGVVMAYGNKGQAVGELQKRLSSLGYYNGEITNLYDKKTQAAVGAFQKNNGIRKSLGKADVDTQSLIYSVIAIPADSKPTPKPTNTPKMPERTLKRGDKGKSVENIQKMLTGLGYYNGNIDGIYNNITIDAVKAFQKNNSLKPDGVCGEDTLNKMFSTEVIYHPSKATIAPLPTPSPSGLTVYPIVDSNTRSIKEGDSGQDVLYLQTKLTELGYYKARMDGNYLADDRAALMAFQKDNGLKQDGIAGYTTLNKLFSDSINVAVSNVNTPSPLSLSLRMGDKGSSVTKLQEKLIELKYLSGKADGIFGESTKVALMAFQKSNKLSQDGIAGASTLEILYSNSTKSNTVKTPTAIIKQGDSSAAVKELQQHLINLGYLTGNADGKFGSTTLLALMKFQARNGLKSDGKAGIQTLEKLKSDNVKIAEGATPTAKPSAPSVGLIPNPSSVMYENWYTGLRALCRKYPNVTVYDYTTGISWQLKIFSTGSHADAVPICLEDTEKMYKAFGNQNTWDPKPVWITFSNGAVYMATMHNFPHGTFSSKSNGFPGHLCVHFPRTLAQVQAIGPYAEVHQNTVDVGWQQTSQLAK